jgi:hypothetical protein
MVFEYWHLGVLAALAGLIVWGVLVSRRRTMLALGVALIVLSGLLLHTLVLEEVHYEADGAVSVLEDVAAIGIPAVAGLIMVVVAVGRGRRR